MNRAKFAELVQAFMARARPGRHLYIWHGKCQALLQILASSSVHRLDIFELLSELSDVPIADEEAGRQLKRLMIKTLTELFTPDKNDPQIVVVTGTVLLARYGGANVFFDFVNDRRMVILQVNDEAVDAETINHLPDYVQVRPLAELETLKRILERPENLVTEE